MSRYVPLLMSTPPQSNTLKIYVTLPGRKKARGFLLHIIAAVSRFGVSPTTGWQVSHLCDRRSCFNPSHLSIETVQENNARKGCVGDLYCSTHADELICPLCPHSPKCIRPPRTDVVCCLMRSKEAAAAAADDSGVGSGMSHYEGEEELEEAMTLGII